MELPHIGKQCSQSTCNKLDFLPINCDACNNVFCDEHYIYSMHNCPKAYLKDNQVPVCPLCNIPISVRNGEQPDYVVGAHIDNDCQSDPAKSRRKAYVNKCSKKGCKTKELIPVICNDCSNNYCLKHRHPTDHNCTRKKNHSNKNKSFEAAVARQRNVSNNISEDEALARAIALSLEESNKLSQEEIDRQLARQLQMMESGATTVGGPSTSNNQNNRCDLQ